MNKGQLYTKIRHKMDMLDVESNTDDYYAEAYPTYIDECLSLIANTVLPYQKIIEVNYGGKLTINGSKYIVWSENNENPYTEYNSIEDLDTTKYYTLGDEIPEIKGHKGDKLFYDTSWTIQKKNSMGYIISIPDDLLSFSDEARPRYESLSGDIILDIDIYYLDPKHLALPKDGNYKIWYNTEYPSVNDVKDENADLDFIPKNVLPLIPIYVASQCLMSEDIQRAMILKNEFENMLARLDDNKVLPSYSIKNESGWTL